MSLGDVVQDVTHAQSPSASSSPSSYPSSSSSSSFMTDVILRDIVGASNAPSDAIDAIVVVAPTATVAVAE